MYRYTLNHHKLVLFQKPPFNFPSGRVVILLKKFDRDGNGKLDIEEFADFYAEAKTTLVYKYVNRLIDIIGLAYYKI